MEGTHTSSFASGFLAFFDFRLSTFSHCASVSSPSGAVDSVTETRGDFFCFLMGQMRAWKVFSWPSVLVRTEFD